MEVLEASLNGTLRTILVLVIVWWVLRMVLRYQRSRGTGPARGGAPQRPKGDVRIERPGAADHPERPTSGNVTDADFEEIK